MSTREDAARATRETAERWIAEGCADLPLPGAGRTWARFEALMSLAREDLAAARIVEAHADAAAIRGELGDTAPASPGELWAVWAAEPPQPRVAAQSVSGDTGDGGGSPDGDSWRLTGTKAWCSAASFATHALITADAPHGAPRLFAVELRNPGVRVEPSKWAAEGMASTDTREVSFEDVPARAVGGPDGYLERAGFWHGGLGVACCWWGGAQGLIDLLAERLRSQRAHPAETAEAHLGACLAWDLAVTGALRSAAADIDAHPHDAASAKYRAFALRSLVDRACADVIGRFGRALGAAPYAADPAAARRIADLQVYTRQSHAERDEVELARLELADTRGASSG